MMLGKKSQETWGHLYITVSEVEAEIKKGNMQKRVLLASRRYSECIEHKAGVSMLQR